MPISKHSNIITVMDRSNPRKIDLAGCLLRMIRPEASFFHNQRWARRQYTRRPVPMIMVAHSGQFMEIFLP